nr:unnamed protein product [Callosobruchus analis]
MTVLIVITTLHWLSSIKGEPLWRALISLILTSSTSARLIGQNINLHSLSLNFDRHDIQNFSYEQFNQIIIDAAVEAIPKKTFNYTGKAGNPWWDDSCSLMVKIRKNKLTQFKLHPTIENFLEAKRQIALTNRHLRKTKKTKFRHFYALNDSDLVLLNTGTTRFTRNNISSAEDLSFASANIATSCVWDTLDDVMGSDHCPL